MSIPCVLQTNEKGQVTVNSSVLRQMEDLKEETGLTCCICREGYRYQPQKVGTSHRYQPQKVGPSHLTATSHRRWVHHTATNHRRWVHHT